MHLLKASLSLTTECLKSSFDSVCSFLYYSFLHILYKSLFIYLEDIIRTMKPLSKDEYISNQAEFRFSIQTFNSISYVSHLFACNYTYNFYNFMLCSLDFTSFISRFIWTHIHNELPINTILYAYLILTLKNVQLNIFVQQNQNINFHQ